MTSDIVWKTASLPDCIVGIPYAASLAQSGAATAFQSSGASTSGLPVSGNLVLNASDHTRITGTATPADVGKYSSVVITIADGAGGVASGTMKLTVRFIANSDIPGLVEQGVSATNIEKALAYRAWPTASSDT